MGLKCGIVGLPNVGKSTLFNALTKNPSAAVANYPFCTIDPNKALVDVPDNRLKVLQAIAGSEKILPATIEFIDIAGLVKGASKGQGLGNQFLSNIRESDAIIHVVRCFEDGDIIHVDNSVNPLRDIETINLELIMSDLAIADKMLVTIQKKCKSGNKEFIEEAKVLEECSRLLNNLEPVINISDKYDNNIVKKLPFITSKPTLYVANINESSIASGNKHTEQVVNLYPDTVIISSKLEGEIAELDDKQSVEFLNEIGIKNSCLDVVINKAYEILNLRSFFTVGPKETRAWSFKNGMVAKETAGIIHTDFEKGFIKAEVISYEDYINYGGETGAKSAGKIRIEGRDYVMKDGDVVHYRFNL